MRSLAKWVCRTLGVVFVTTGLVTFVSGAEADRYHNLLHFLTGVIAFYFGFRGSPSAARGFCWIFGGGYLAFGILGILIGAPEMDRLWHVGPLHLAQAEHVFHIVLGAVVLAGGIFTKVQARQPTPVAR